MLTVALALTLHCVAAAPDATPAGEVAAQAEAAYEAGRYEEAARLFERVFALTKEPRFLYNLARSYEGARRPHDAHSTYLRILASPTDDEAMMAAARTRVAKLELELERGAIAWRPLTGELDGAWLQLDGAVLEGLAERTLLEPGRHQLCLHHAGGRQVQCWRRHVVAGELQSWPPASGEPSRGTLRLSPDAGALRLEVDGYRVWANLGRLETLELEAGEHAVALALPDGTTMTVTIAVVAGHEQALGPGTASTARTVEGGPAPAATLVVVSSADARAGAWAFLGVGIAAALGGAGLCIAGGVERDRVKSAAVDDSGVVVGLTEGEAITGWRRAEDETLAGALIAGAGVALVVGGVLWAVLAPSEAPEHQVLPTAGGVAWTGRF